MPVAAINMKTAINIVCYQHKILRSPDLQLKVNGEKFYCITGLALLKSPNMYVRDVIKFVEMITFLASLLLCSLGHVRTYIQIW